MTTKTIEKTDNGTQNVATDEQAAIERYIITNKLQLWRNTLYDAQLDAKIGETLDDAEMKKQAIERMKKSQKAIDLLEAELNKL